MKYLMVLTLILAFSGPSAFAGAGMLKKFAGDHSKGDCALNSQVAKYSRSTAAAPTAKRTEVKRKGTVENRRGRGKN